MPVLGILFICVLRCFAKEIHIDKFWFESRYGLYALKVKTKTFHIKLILYYILCILVYMYT